jgi:two-component system sensor histidine kinase KdpD
VDADIADEAQIVEVHGDLIEQVFVNLLDNAARHSATPATIRVTARKSDEGIVIEVLDDGPGIPEREREKVFEPFYRIRDGVRESGAGLGLSICRGIIRTHGGDITAHASPDGRGSLLRIRLPASSANPPVISDESE